MRAGCVYVVALVLAAACGAAAAGVDLYRWSEETGELMTVYSYALSCSNATLESWTCQWCTWNEHIAALDVVGFPYDRSDDVLGAVGINHADRQIIVAFRGTDPSSLDNILVDINVFTVKPYPDVPEVLVHKGFYNGYKKLRPQVLAFLQPLADAYPDYPIVMTGHSLGAALTSLCAIDLARLGLKDRLVQWDLGCPRVGNTAYANYYNSLIPQRFRMVWERDIVPQHPSESFGKGWRHAAREYWHYKHAWRACSPYDGEDPSCQNSLWGITTVSISDHLNYFNLEWTQKC